MSLKPATKNAIQCWLYDAIYRHIPAGRQPNADDLIKDAYKAKRPANLSGVPIVELEKMIRIDVSQNKFRIAPSPCNDQLKKLFPNWSRWHHAGPAQSQPSQPTPRKAPKPPAEISVPPTPGLQGTQFTTPPSVPGKAPASRKMKSHQFRQTEYQARAIASNPENSSPQIPPPSYRVEGSLKLSARNLINNSNAMFHRSTAGDSNVQISTEPIISTAPLFTSDVIQVDSSIDNAADSSIQFGVFARLNREGPRINHEYDAEPEDDMVFLNTNTPFTTFICGLQGSGKSHSLSVIMENCIIQDPGIGILHRPLAGIVFYFSPFTPLDTGKPCEVAYLSVPSNDPASPAALPDSHARKVTVLVSRSNLPNMQKVYGKIPGVTVYPLLLKASQLTAKTMLHLMSVQEDNTSLYLQIFTRILRDMAAEGDFDYEKFKAQLSLEPFNSTQWALLDLRLELLESFLGAEGNPNPFDPSEGSITIVDLTCPFVDAETACVLFSICLDLFCSSPSTTGKIVALDEAHKFMSDSSSSQQFAKSVIQNIRLQRHLGLRTIISTQDPQVHPELLELASYIIMHRFDSPRWFSTLRHHVGFDNATKFSSPGDDRETNEQAANAFEQIMCLNAGQALVYCPRLITVDYRGGYEKIVRLGTKLIKMQVRRRVTFDGGVTKTAL